MKIRIKRTICVTLAWIAFMLMLGVVFGVEKGWSDIKAMWWYIPCLAVWAGGLWKGGWLKV